MVSGLKIISEKIPESQVLLKIEVEPETVERSLEQAYRRVVNRINIPGFRRGKAPRQIVERMIGREALLQEGLELLLPEVYKQAVDETGIKPVDRPGFNVVQLEPLLIDITVPVEPIVQLGNYKQIRLSPEEVKVTEAQRAMVLAQLQEEHATWVPMERPILVRDLVDMDVISYIAQKPLLYSSSGDALLSPKEKELVWDEKGLDYLVAPELQLPVPGFAEQLVGLHPGEEKEFDLTIPDSYRNPQVAGQRVTVKVVVHSVKEKHLPPLDDNFARMVGDYEDLEALKKDIMDSLQKNAEAEANQRFEETLLKIVGDQAEVEVPSSMVDRELDYMVENLTNSLKKQNSTLERYLKVIKKTEEELKEELRPQAKQHVKNFWVLEAVAEAEGIVVTPGEVEAEIERIAGSAGSEDSKGLIATSLNRESIMADLRHRKTVERIKESATSEEIYGPSLESADSSERGQVRSEE